MIAVLLVGLIFAAGFGSGYAVRAKISRLHRDRYRRNSVYGPSSGPLPGAIGHHRRAF